MSNKQDNSKPLSVEAQNFLKLLRSQKSQDLHTSKNQRAIKIKSQPEESSQKNQPQWDLQIQSESAMEAEQLFGNLAPQDPIEQKKQKNSIKKQQKLKPSGRKQIDLSQQEQKIIQTKSILKKGKIREEINEKMSEDQQQSEKEQIQTPDPKRKTVQFEGMIPLNSEFEKKWDDPIENQRKGKFDKQEEKVLSQAVGKFLVSNDISIEEFEKLLTMGQRSDKISKKQKIFSLLSTVLPNRSPQSCYKYLKRNFNSLNRKGKWTADQIDKLKILVEKYGRKWTLISRELKRSSDNCYDKFRQMGEENMDERVKGIWRFSELVQLLKLVQKMTKIKFLSNIVDKQLERADQHDAAQRQEVTSRKYNSKNFIFHNIAILKPFLNGKNFQKIDISQIRWNEIATYLKTRNTLDCRNKTVQLLQIFFHTEAKELDETVVDFLILNKYQNEHEINWKDWKNKQITAEQAKNRYMIIKKMVQGRSVMPFKEIVVELKRRIEKKLKQKSSPKEKKEKKKFYQIVEEE